MPAWAIPILQKVVAPLAIKLASWIYANHKVGEVQDNQTEIKKQRNAMMKAITKADNDEDRISYSIILGKLERGKLSVEDAQGFLQSPGDSTRH